MSSDNMKGKREQCSKGEKVADVPCNILGQISNTWRPLTRQTKWWTDMARWSLADNKQIVFALLPGAAAVVNFSGNPPLGRQMRGRGKTRGKGSAYPPAVNGRYVIKKSGRQ